MVANKYHENLQMINLNKKNEILPPVFIIGAGRSGTTLLYKMLCMHSEIAWISNYYNKFPDCFFLSFINRINHISKRKCCTIWFSKNSNAYFSHRKRLKRIFPVPKEGEVLYKRCGIPLFPNPIWHITNAQKECIINSFEKIRYYQGASVFVTKRTANNRRIATLIKVFPKAKFIHIIRDGRAVAFSLLNVEWWNDHKVWWWQQRTPRQWEEEGNSPIEMAARNWVEEINAIRFGLAHVPKNQIYEIRYEELQSNYLDILMKVARFIGIYPDYIWMKTIKSLSVINKNNTWLEKSSDSEQAILNKVQYDTLKLLGYI